MGLTVPANTYCLTVLTQKVKMSFYLVIFGLYNFELFGTLLTIIMTTGLIYDWSMNWSAAAPSF